MHMRMPVWVLTLSPVLFACPASADAPPTTPASKPAASKSGTERAEPPAPGLEVATFAGGCFWCMEPPFEKLDGVKAVLSGYTGGPEARPQYKQVARGRTGHAEAVRVLFDPDEITYRELLETFWRNIDPTDAGGQFVDRGRQYRTGIFVHSDMQRREAEDSKSRVEASQRFERIVTPIEDAGPFWVAEQYHQDFYRKRSEHYRRYRAGSGRDAFIERHWGAKKP